MAVQEGWVGKGGPNGGRKGGVFGAVFRPPEGSFSKASGFYPEEAHFAVFKAFSYLEIEIEMEMDMEVEIRCG